MSGPRLAAAAVLASRIAYGVTLTADPDRLTRRWLGPGGSRSPAQVALRALGARETLIHVGGLVATVTGRPVRPWLAMSVAGDLTDIAATAGARRGLPEDAPKLTALVAGGSAALSALVAALVDG
jgi:hypothetical protein